MLAACTGGPRHGEPLQPGSRLAYPAQPVVAAAPAPPVQLSATQASIAGSVLQIRYRDADAEYLASGVLPPDVNADARNLDASPTQPPVIVFSTRPVLAPGPELSGAPVSIRSPQSWRALLLQLEAEIAAQVPNQGVVLDVLRQHEIFLFVDPQGQLQAVPIEDMAADIAPAAAITLTDLLSNAATALRQSLQHKGEHARYLLFNTADLPETGFPFVFIDLADGRVFFMQQPDHRKVVVQGPLLAAQATYHVITSQVTSVTTRPVSSFARLLSSLGGTAVDTLKLPPADLEPGLPVPPLGDAPGMDLAAWERELDQLTGSTGSYGQLDYLVDGAAFFPALIHAVDQASESLRMRMYIFDNDDYAVKIADRLKTRSHEVSVQILLDGLGTIAGGMVRPAYTPSHAPRRPWSISAYLQSDSAIRLRQLGNPWLQGDHTKVIIADDRVAFLGGMNIGREYRYEWHDLMVETQGPVVDELIRDFENAWSHAGVLGDLQAAIRRSRRPVRDPGPQDYPLRLLYTRPGASQILRAQIAAMRRAQSRVWIENPYLTSDAVLYELVAARRRGVDVRVILPYRTDAGLIGRSNALAANFLLRHGVRVYIYPGMSHVKAAVYDGWACTGSANFDRLSLRLNKETNIATSHRDAVDRLVRMLFVPDFAHALELHERLPASWLDYLRELIADQL